MVLHTTSDEFGFDNEAELKDWLEVKFKDSGWDCIREVKPDHSDYRADLLLLHDRFGRIGVEVKLLEPGDSAALIADAHKQITKQYWNKKYFGEKVLLWAACIYEKYLYENDDYDDWRLQHTEKRATFTREFLCRYGIGVLRLGGYAEFDFNYSNRSHKIPAFPITTNPKYDDFESVNMETLKDSIKKKRGVDYET